MFADFFDLRFQTFGGSIISLAEGGKFGPHYSSFGNLPYLALISPQSGE